MQRRAFILLFAGAVTVGALGSRAEAGELKTLTVDQVAAKLKAPKTFIYDNNSQESYKAGHLPGAKWLDDEKVTADALPGDKSAMLIFYCHNET